MNRPARAVTSAGIWYTRASASLLLCTLIFPTICGCAYYPEVKTGRDISEATSLVICEGISSPQGWAAPTRSRPCKNTRSLESIASKLESVSTIRSVNQWLDRISSEGGIELAFPYSQDSREIAYELEDLFGNPFRITVMRTDNFVLTHQQHEHLWVDTVES